MWATKRFEFVQGFCSSHQAILDKQGQTRDLPDSPHFASQIEVCPTPPPMTIPAPGGPSHLARLETKRHVSCVKLALNRARGTPVCQGRPELARSGLPGADTIWTGCYLSRGIALFVFKPQNCDVCPLWVRETSGDRTKLVLNNLISIFRYHEK
jgi:hypothetical protein